MGIVNIATKFMLLYSAIQSMRHFMCEVMIATNLYLISCKGNCSSISYDEDCHSITIWCSLDNHGKDSLEEI